MNYFLHNFLIHYKFSNFTSVLFRRQIYTLYVGFHASRLFDGVFFVVLFSKLKKKNSVTLVERQR